MTVSVDAASLLAWLKDKSPAQVERELAKLDDHHPLLGAAHRLADAADSDDEAVRADGLKALFAGFIEPLNDSFSPVARDVYARLFSAMVWRVASRDANLSAALRTGSVADFNEMHARYCAARTGKTPVPNDVRTIAVLSRVTLGADILITSVALQRLHQRYPHADIVLIGDAKLGGLFAGLPRVRVAPVSYSRRGALRERLSSWTAVAGKIAHEGADLVVSPDSRLDQLGILPVIADASRYLLWENTQPAGKPLRSLSALFDEWLVRRLGLPQETPVHPRVAFDPATEADRQRLRAAFGGAPIAAVKLDHGGNAAKALPRAAELAILRRLREQGWRVLLDRGFGAEELANSDALVKELGWQAHDIDDSGKNLGTAVAGLQPGQLAQHDVIRFHGSISGWAAATASCKLAFSYDSVGHHLAAALGVPVIVAFTGFTHPEFPIAWQPRGPAAITLVTFAEQEKPEPAQWRRVIDAIPAPG